MERKRSPSSIGTPSSSAITVIGSGRARSAIRLNSSRTFPSRSGRFDRPGPRRVSPTAPGRTQSGHRPVVFGRLWRTDLREHQHQRATTRFRSMHGNRTHPAPPERTCGLAILARHQFQVTADGVGFDLIGTLSRLDKPVTPDLIPYCVTNPIVRNFRIQQDPSYPSEHRHRVARCNHMCLGLFIAMARRALRSIAPTAVSNRSNTKSDVAISLSTAVATRIGYRRSGAMRARA